MVPLDMVLRHELRHCPSEVAFAQRDDLPQALRLDRQDEPFRVRIQVRTPRRQLEARDTSSPQQAGELPREQRVAVVDQVFDASRKIAVEDIIATELRRVRARGEAGAIGELRIDA